MGQPVTGRKIIRTQPALGPSPVFVRSKDIGEDGSKDSDCHDPKKRAVIERSQPSRLMSDPDWWAVVLPFAGFAQRLPSSLIPRLAGAKGESTDHPE
jgi:hypothetical protein